jgi:hypothetical protein
VDSLLDGAGSGCEAGAAQSGTIPPAEYEANHYS